MVATWSAARRRVRRAGERITDRLLLTGRARAKDTALTVAAMVPAALFWVMVLAGSFHGLVAFGRDMVGWRGGWEYLVPGTLDGVSVTFAFLAFRAVRKAKAPDRCRRVVWGAAFASATVNFAYEHADSGGNIVAGGYVALLSLFGMIMFHEFLDQFEEGTGQIRRANPAFGLRWVTWPTNTFCAAVAWHNHPPAEDTPATVRSAVANLDRVRALKREAKQAAIAARHERALDQARRKAAFAAASAETPEPVAAPPVLAPATAPAGPAEMMTARDTFGAPAAAAPPPDSARKPSQGNARLESGAGDVRVPATAATLDQWALTWVRMCADGDTAFGPLNDDVWARERYGLSAKQLRNIRNAATSGALRRRAADLGVPLPADYSDQHTRHGINGHRTAAAAA